MGQKSSSSSSRKAPIGDDEEWIVSMLKNAKSVIVDFSEELQSSPPIYSVVVTYHDPVQTGKRHNRNKNVGSVKSYVSEPQGYKLLAYARAHAISTQD